MIDISPDLSDIAQSQFGVANTPLFTVNRLKEQPQIVAMSRLRSQDELLASLDVALQLECPTTLAERAKPYIFVAALSLKNPAALRKYLGKAHSGYRWFDRSINFFSRVPTSSNGFTILQQTPQAQASQSQTTRIILP